MNNGALLWSVGHFLPQQGLKRDALPWCKNNTVWQTRVMKMGASFSLFLFLFYSQFSPSAIEKYYTEVVVLQKKQRILREDSVYCFFKWTSVDRAGYQIMIVIAS